MRLGFKIGSEKVEMSIGYIDFVYGAKPPEDKNINFNAPRQGLVFRNMPASLSDTCAEDGSLCIILNRQVYYLLKRAMVELADYVRSLEDTSKNLTIRNNELNNAFNIINALGYIPKDVYENIKRNQTKDDV